MKKITLLAAFLLCINSFATIVVRDITDYTFTTTNTSLDFDFNSDGTNEFTFILDNGLSCLFYTNPDLNFVTSGTIASGYGWDIMKSLPFNTLISSASNFAAEGDAYFNPFWANAPEMFPAGDSYVGTKFKIGTSIYYGWILVNSTGDASGTFTVKSYAYNNVANQQIYAGQTVLANDNFNTVNYKVSPNPVNDNFSIESNSNVAAFKVSLMDINGKTINLEATNDLFNVASLNSGIYILRIEDNDGKLEIKKIIKN